MAKKQGGRDVFASIVGQVGTAGKTDDSRGLHTRRTPIGELAHRAVDSEMLQKLAKEGRAIIEVEPNLVDRTEFVDRLERAFYDERFVELRQSISENGQMVPVLLRPKGQRFEIVFGHRRVEACKQLGRKVRAMVADVESLQDLVRRMVRENEDREGLSVYERGCNVKTWIDKGIFSNDEVQELLGLSRQAVGELLVLAELPQQAIKAIGDPRDIPLNVGTSIVRALRNVDADLASAAYAKIQDGGTSSERAKQLLRLLTQKESTTKEKRKISTPSGLVIGTLTTSGRQTVLRFSPDLTSETMEEVLRLIQTSKALK